MTLRRRARSRDFLRQLFARKITKTEPTHDEPENGKDPDGGSGSLYLGMSTDWGIGMLDFPIEWNIGGLFSLRSLACESMHVNKRSRK